MSRKYHIRLSILPNVEMNVVILFINNLLLLLRAIIIINDKQFTSIECQSFSEMDPLVHKQFPLFLSPFPPMTQQDTIRNSCARCENNLSREKIPAHLQYNHRAGCTNIFRGRGRCIVNFRMRSTTYTREH